MNMIAFHFSILIKHSRATPTILLLALGIMSQYTATALTTPFPNTENTSALNQQTNLWDKRTILPLEGIPVLIGIGAAGVYIPYFTIKTITKGIKVAVGRTRRRTCVSKHLLLEWDHVQHQSNVLVYNLANNYTFSGLIDMVPGVGFECAGVNYNVIHFTSGNITRVDGGDGRIHWGFLGNFEKDDKTSTIVFHPILKMNSSSVSH